MKIRDVERLLDSHARLVKAAIAVLGTSADDVCACKAAGNELALAMVEARQVRTEIGRPLP